MKKITIKIKNLNLVNINEIFVFNKFKKKKFPNQMFFFLN